MENKFNFNKASLTPHKSPLSGAFLKRLLTFAENVI